MSQHYVSIQTLSYYMYFRGVFVKFMLRFSMQLFIMRR